MPLLFVVLSHNEWVNNIPSPLTGEELKKSRERRVSYPLEMRKDKYNVDHIGYNARLDTLQAAILLAKFNYIDEFNTKRRVIAGAYDEGFKNNDKIVVPISLKDTHHVYHQYTLRVKDSKREALQKLLNEIGVSTMIYYPVPLHRMKVFNDGRCKVAGGLRNSEESSLGVISLPVEPLQIENDTAYVVDCVNRFA